MKKTILIGLGVFALATVHVLNIRTVKDGNNGIMTLNSLVKIALADDEEQNCPGGTCAFTKYLLNGDIDWECSACCPEGKNPQCDQTGCICH